MAEPLETMRERLVDDNATIMAVSLLVIGVSMIGNGIGGLPSSSQSQPVDRGLEPAAGPGRVHLG
jgi:hypothetical protein